jgi:uncharacterized linocin/CFP29 family protein
MSDAAVTEVGKTFWNGSSGRWAGEQLLKCLQEGKPVSPAALRTLTTLRKDEWVNFDQALVEEATLKLRAVADVLQAGLTVSIANGLGKTIHEYEKVDDMEPAIVSMDGAVRTDSDRQEFSPAYLPLPITHKDFYINLRTLMASRERGESLDTTQIRTAGRLVAEASENMLINGGKTFGGYPIYGYTNHPDVNTATFQTNGSWDETAKVGADILEDVLTMMQAAEDDRMNGPYWLYCPRNASTKLEDDFKANSDKTIRQRVLEVDGILNLQVLDYLATDYCLLVQATSDVVQMVNGEALQTIQWDIEGGMKINFKAFQIQVPLIKSDAQGRSGIVVMTNA